MYLLHKAITMRAALCEGFLLPACRYSLEQVFRSPSSRALGAWVGDGSICPPLMSKIVPRRSYNKSESKHLMSLSAF